MQISHVQVTPVEFSLRHPYRTTYREEISRSAAVFIRLDTREGKVAWGCGAFVPDISGETLGQVTRLCHACADRSLELNPLNIEHAMSELSQIAAQTPAALCAFDMAFHDLLGLATGLPLHRLLGGYRQRVQTSITLGIASVEETIEMAHQRARQGFGIIKLKGGLDAAQDVQRVHAVHDALPHLTLRLDADQGYNIQQALDVARALRGCLEMIEQPTPAQDIESLRQVSLHSPTPILADEGVSDPAAALRIAGQQAAHGLSVKLARCGGLRRAAQIDAIARAARLSTMIGCVNEPALLIAAGLGFALSSSNVHYADLDGHFDLIDDPTIASFRFQEGWLIASDVPGLGCAVEL